jgi:extracellular factor (EF) 3-hydroxypalmitic acid methyl ester biosynthesis protein
MDHVLEWRLIHRAPDDLRGLFARSKFGGAPVEVRREEAGINLFAFCARDGAP